MDKKARVKGLARAWPTPGKELAGSSKSHHQPGSDPHVHNVSGKTNHARDANGQRLAAIPAASSLQRMLLLIFVALSVPIGCFCAWFAWRAMKVGKKGAAATFSGLSLFSFLTAAIAGGWSFLVLNA